MMKHRFRPDPSLFSDAFLPLASDGHVLALRREQERLDSGPTLNRNHWGFGGALGRNLRKFDERLSA